MTDQTNDTPAKSFDDALIVSEFWANRRGESVRIQIREFEGRRIIDLRKFFTGKDGKLHPGKMGLSLSVRKLPELASGINKAMATASDLGLLHPSERKP